MFRIAVDCFGGDYSPEANVQGALFALEKIEETSLILVGDEEKIKQQLQGKRYDSVRIEILHAPTVIGCDEKPTDAIRLKRDSSMMQAVRLLREHDDVSGMVSTGSTGALVAAGMLRLERLKGVIRPAFCPVIPTVNGGIVGICDTGANVDIAPEYLRQYAVMGSLYLSDVYGVKKPRVALLNIGIEAEKGDDLHRTAYKLLKSTPGINFVGNMESRDLVSGNYDLVVCDGFSGNVLIKSTEGTCLEVFKKLKKDISASLWNRIGALFLYRMFMKEKKFMDYQNYGGSVLLGTSKVIIKGHGSSGAPAVEKSIEQAWRMSSSQVGAKIEQALFELQENEENQYV